MGDHDDTRQGMPLYQPGATGFKMLFDSVPVNFEHSRHELNELEIIQLTYFLYYGIPKVKIRSLKWNMITNIYCIRDGIIRPGLQL